MRSLRWRRAFAFQSRLAGGTPRHRDAWFDASIGTRMRPAASGTPFSPPRRQFFRNMASNSALTGAPANLQMLARSAFGLVDVCNLLPEHVVEWKSVAAMQLELQMLLKSRAFDWRRQLASHLLATCPSVRASVASFFLRLRSASFTGVALQSLLVACGFFRRKKVLQFLSPIALHDGGRIEVASTRGSRICVTVALGNDEDAG